MADATITQAVDLEYLRETLAWVRRNFEGEPSKVREQLDLALGHIVSALPSPARGAERGVSAEDAKIIENLMCEIERDQGLHSNERAALDRLRSAYNLGRPVPDHGSGPTSFRPGGR